MQLQLEGVSHYYGKRPVLIGLNLGLDEGEIGVLVGPSGAGKSTVLNCIAGLEHVREGTISIGGTVVSSPDVHVPPENRAVGMMFQDCALFPHLDVARNIAFGLRDGEDATTRVDEMAELCGLREHLTCLPHELSGGEQQRVALARALAPQPRLLMLDEPFSDSDVLLRAHLLKEVREIVRRQGCTMLLVTHDQNEAFALADRCGVIDAGNVCQWDTPYNLYHRPNCLFVADFIGEGVFIKGELVSATEVATELGTVRAAAPLTTPLMGKGSTVRLLLRPDDVVRIADGEAGIDVHVTGKSFRGADTYYELTTTQGTALSIMLPSGEELPQGEGLKVTTSMEHVVVFPAVG